MRINNEAPSRFAPCADSLARRSFPRPQMATLSHRTLPFSAVPPPMRARVRACVLALPYRSTHANAAAAAAAVLPRDMFCGLLQKGGGTQSVLFLRESDPFSLMMQISGKQRYCAATADADPAFRRVSQVSGSKRGLACLLSSLIRRRPQKAQSLGFRPRCCQRGPPRHVASSRGEYFFLNKPPRSERATSAVVQL